MKLVITSTKSHTARINFWRRFFAIWLILGIAFGGQALTNTPVARAATNTLTLSVIAARTDGGWLKGESIPAYKYLINVDNTGDPTQDREAGCTPGDSAIVDGVTIYYPDTCDWPSIRAVPGAAPIFAEGNQDDFLAGGIILPDGNYLVSVLADGFKLGGAHFTVPLPDPDPLTGANVIVELQPHPLPAATMRIKVFEDISPTNGMFDAPAEFGMAGFKAVINDTVGQISTDVFGNPLCTLYDAFGEPLPPEQQIGDACLFSDANGDITIPNIGPLRYDVFVIAPDGQVWLETTTLEGSWSWDTWLQEGGTGLDNEFVVAGEPFPWTVFGFVSPCQLGNLADRCPANDGLGAATGGVSGNLIEASIYLPQQGGLPYAGNIWTGFNGTKVTGPITDGWIAISDLQQGDTAIYVGPANPDGTYSITGLPDGDYLFTWWDYNLHHILDWIQVSVADGQVTDMGSPMLSGWFTKVEGYVFIDTDKDGFKDEGEPGKADYLVVLKDRDNSEIDRMSISAITGHDGYYVFEKAYPMSSWMILEAYNDRYYTTGITYQVDNQIDENGNPVYTIVPGNGVDVGILPILGQPARLDWGIYPYTDMNSDFANGGIVGTVFYDTTRNELNPQYQAVEPWAAGVPGLTMNLYAPVPCTPGVPCDALGMYQLDADGSYLKGALLNTTTTETWEQPSGCTARDANGDPLPWGTPDQEVLPTTDFATQDTTARCLEAPLMGTQIQSGFASLDGNWGFTDGCFGPGNYATGEGTCAIGDPTSLPAGDYLVEVDIPQMDINLSTGPVQRPMYQVVREEDINVFGGDQFEPAVPPPACAGPLHTVDVANDPSGIDNHQSITLQNGIVVPASTPVVNASFADAGGSVYEGQPKPTCETKLVNLANGKSIAPAFNLFTDVPIPGKWKGYIIDDLTISTDPKSLNFGEKAGLANAPIGIYDFNNRLVKTIQSDPNGVFEVLLPSTHTMNCPTPSGVCPNIYYMLGNDPGQPPATPGGPSQLNENYNPQYRTIGASFEIYPGLIIPSDLAPTQMVPGILAGGTQFGTPPQCSLDAATPQLFAVDHPYVPWGGANRTITIKGQGFGSYALGSSQVTLDGAALTINSWSDTEIIVEVPAGAPFGTPQLAITTADSKKLVNGLTIHVLGASSFPQTGVLDDFNRLDGNLGANWGSPPAGTFRILTNQVQVRAAGSAYWWPTSFGADQEAYFTFTDISGAGREQGLLLKFSGTSPAANNAAWINVAYIPPNSVVVRTKVPGQGQNNATLQATFPATFTTGQQLGARVQADGTVKVFQNGTTLIGQVSLATTANPWPEQFLAGGGSIGVRFFGSFTGANDARFDNFGGGTLAVPDYEPALYEVPTVYASIQSALDAAALSPAANNLVVVYPGTPQMWNPGGAYYENLIVYEPVKLQGVGPGGGAVPGSVIDGRGVAGDTIYAEEWRVKVAGLNWSGNQAIYEGAVVYVLAEDGEFRGGYKAAIDGFTITGGDQQGFPNQLGNVDPNLKEAQAVQGGGIFANGYARHLQITNNILQSNGGAYAGAIRLGTPHLPDALNDNQNDFVRIAQNRILANGGTNLAGAIGLFSGSEGYEIANNDICGNFSAEYGGGVSHYGLSPNGSIHHNRVYFNRSYDEGGGIIIAGELQPDPSMLTPGAGPVNVYNNLIQGNLGNDDGGGLRFLMAGNFPYNVYNNMIVNNISTHEGGGISINDAPDVRIFNNTIMKNITTATAMTSNGQPAPAGLSTSGNSALLQATLPLDAPLFSDPVVFNNIFWDNRAGTFTGATVAGIGLLDDPNPIFNWDLGVAGMAELLSPAYSLLQTAYGASPDANSLVGVDPLVVLPYETSVQVAPWRGNPRFVDVLMVTVLATPNFLGDYHLTGGSQAIDAGTATGAPGYDFDDQLRPQGEAVDIGADEVPPPPQ